MIKILKKRLFNLLILSAFLYFVLPIFLTSYIAHNLSSLFIFFLANIFIGLFLFNKHSKKKYNLQNQSQGLEEKINILNDRIARSRETKLALSERIARYNNLKTVVEKLSENLDLDSVAGKLVTIAFSLISNNRGVCILYLIDKQLNLEIFKAKKENESLILKAKEGDIFDFWVLRHTSPLLVEDIKSDFRFDLEKLKVQDPRKFSSLISSPLVSEHRFLGTLRMDNEEHLYYSQDDLRLLVAVCDLGAVALENCELFQRIKDLATHDGLTGLFTKGYFLERLKGESARASRLKIPFSLLMLDIDFFKDYNDKFGHTAGDIVLKRMANVIIESLKGQNHVVSRFGGEEICVILFDTQKKNAIRTAETLRRKIQEEKMVLRRQETSITVSIGVAAFPTDAALDDELIQKADNAMYQAKLKGRNQVCW